MVGDFDKFFSFSFSFFLWQNPPDHVVDEYFDKFFFFFFFFFFLWQNPPDHVVDEYLVC